MKTKDMYMSSSSLLLSPAPKSADMNAPEPMHSPIIIDVMNTMSVYEEPTAASAPAPRYFPTINVSTRLYTC